MRKLSIWTLRIFILAFALWAAAQGRQWLFRHRAEKLLADIKALELNRSTWADAQKLMNKWGSWGSWYGECTAQSCQYSIDMNDWLPGGPQFVYENGPHITTRLLDHLGLRSSDVSAGFNVVQGVITNRHFRMDVALPFRDWGVPNGTYWPSLEDEFSEAATLRYDNSNFRASRPNRAFARRRILLEVAFTPEESSEEKIALMNFNMDCINRWSPCCSPLALLPRAEEEFQAEIDLRHRQEALNKETEDDNFYTPTCFPTVEIRAREERDILVGDVVRTSVVQAPADSDPSHSVWKIDVRLAELLKGKASQPIGSIVTVYEPSKNDPSPVDKPWPLHTVLVMGMTGEEWNTHNPVFYSGDCGTVEASVENLAAAKLGIKEDFGSRY